MIAFDASSQGSALPGNSVTFAHTCSGSDRILIVGITSNNADVITGVTYNGTAMTLAKKSTFAGPTMYLYYLLAPDTGANNVVVSASGAGEYIRVSSVSYTGVQQSGQPDATDEESASATSVTSSLTQAVTHAWQIGLVQGGHDGTVTAGSGVGSIRRTVTGGYNSIGDSNARTSVGTQSMTWNQGGSAGFQALQISIVDVVQASASPSLSPSLSSSVSRSPSSSTSPSSSISLSPSVSVSLSPSASISTSNSISPSPSLSASLSLSASPSSGYSLYTRGDEASLPSLSTDLETTYTDEEETKVATRNDIRVGQTGTLEYMIHQYKSFVGTVTNATIEWEGRSTLAPKYSTIYLQAFNTSTNAFVTIASNSTADEDIDIELFASLDLTNYKDSSNVVTVRVYQLAL